MMEFETGAGAAHADWLSPATAQHTAWHKGLVRIVKVSAAAMPLPPRLWK